jgi:DNA modification methylase
MADIEVRTGDAFDVLPTLAADHVHAVVTDPPYGLAFMGRSWDDFEPREYQAWCEEWAAEVKRVLKPGGHLLAFSGNRTHHRLFSGVEDAGFEIRDTITWHYGSGFPKALDVSKAIDKQRDDEKEQRIVCRWLRERIEASQYTVDDIADHFGFHSRMVDHWAARDTDSQPETPTLDQWRELKRLLGFGDEMDDLVNWLNERKGEPAESWDEREVVDTITKAPGWDYDGGNVYEENGSVSEKTLKFTAPATDAAEKWDGFKTALKPATEYVVVARKPLSEDTVAENVQTHGTGALNIDGTRIETSENLNGGSNKRDEARVLGERHNPTAFQDDDYDYEQSEEGRYPSNVVFDATEAERLDREVGETESKSGGKSTGFSGDVYGDNSDEYAKETQERVGYDGKGGPSRYFYTSKASRSERTENGRLPNDHPTVKPLDLMQWLVRLVTAEGQVVCDPFAGSGTTLKAAKELGRGAIGIERQPEYADLARARAGLTPEEPGRFVDDAATTLAAYTDGGAE